MSTTSISTSNTVAILGGVVGIGPTAATLTVDGLQKVTVDLGLGLISNFVVDGSPDSNVTVDDLIGLVSTLTMDTDGADFTFNENGLASAAILSGTTVDIDGGTFQIGSALITANVLSSTALSFGTGGGTDLITASDGFIAVDLLSSAGPITGFDSSADIIADQALDFAAITGYSISPESGSAQTVTVLTSDNTNLTFALDVSTLPGGTPLASNTFSIGDGPLDISANNGGGVQITLCFLGGTMIATPDGEAAVETLKPGDLVLTADGRIVPVRWIGINTIATRFADPLRNVPIRITAGALGENLPKRDLKLSPDHALLIDGVLVQAAALINGTTIQRMSSMPEVFHYYHVEVAAHDLILAEGVTAETFVDNVSRMAFDNWEEFAALCDGEPPTGEMDYPRAQSYRQVPSHIHRRLAARAGQMNNDAAA